MTDKFELSRRKVLGGLGTIGVASAGAGLGTTAFFSDTESFDGNQLTAGSLDLKVDWEEHYSDWSEDESKNLNYDVKMSAPSDTSNWVGLPNPSDPLIWVHRDDLGTFMDNTSIEAYPDDDDDGIQDDLEQYDACDDFADTPEDLDPRIQNALRTKNDDTLMEDKDGNVVPAPLVNLHDVKPGDFGELTLSFHLCDNPGYVWLNGELVSASENGHTEPERKDPDEMSGTVELLDAIQTQLWYDEDGDNVFEPGRQGQPICVQLVLDASGSMAGDRNTQAKNAANLLADEILDANPDNRVGVTYFGENNQNARVVQTVTDDGTAVENAIDGLPAEDGTPIGDGIEAADEDLANCPSDAFTTQIVITDGQHNLGTDPSEAANDVTGSDSDDYTDEIFAVGTGGATESSLAEFARPADQGHIFFTGEANELVDLLAQISQILVGEQEFFRGTLRELLEAVGTDFGIPLDGNRSTAYDEVDSNKLPNSGDDPNRECFVNSTNNFIGLSWWLPVDHANEIQTDTVSFDLGFYTEQCRHNSGAGQA
ncbi:VWA domain-containing protein [Halomicroarcula sp. F13]|uniref:VWA domain-containing protein n=1 Tax=Haloarcula rubra TaxID=2487747 RepID=A0AAW4PTL3_9EURY|nr:SipW-dependent-type signal peptide and vWA domain-containing protein [Halomicroarcula rubra]MBX0324333.1 VWA domain-containing protein [Halomicroarcula rubra]